MANESLQTESDHENPLDFIQVSNRIFAVEETAAQISALAHTISRNRDLDTELSAALSGIGSLAELARGDLARLIEDTSAAAKVGGNVVDLTAKE